MKILNDIQPSQNIGDSLDFINDNFEILDSYVANFNNTLNASKEMVINSSYLDSISGINLDEISALVARLSTIINFVEINKGKWSKPFSIFYPQPLEVNSVITFNDLGTWLNNNYPVIDIQNGDSNYTIDQEAIVYLFVNDVVQELKEEVLLKDSTTCDASNVKVCGQCSVMFYSTDSVPNNCSSYSLPCQECLTPDCYYYGQPYTQNPDLKLKIADSSISAKITLNFTNTYENNIVGAKFKVNASDQWTYSGLLS